ncbi:tRNA glutamyl-Q(34) synthetase GluQRS [Falsigemmobacter faecalis]|uniref:tRNA glutamyl-Q(34) synthetase GluQRS n=1 Tax=Falsigemmobacter faecalis TaxID=2488730 RepID=A0A3P3DTH3_9RHOB|nr:tRNA glutamyl-Q(34) synthetase GluQRS [Falsigemmobacter faecalis]RRH76986.1 tRNA glutamyl-Q(34) synthetase GluQRS [Falsigemmobacter faecalis]
MAPVTRFAPSPTGPLHLGHAFAAMVAHDLARAHGGRFLLRIEDIDPQRSKPQWEAQLLDDLRWLGLSWDAEPLRQSDRRPVYSAALDRMWQAGLIYPCRCSRRDIELALGAPQEGASHAEGPDGPVYPGPCRCRPEGPRPGDQHLRLNIAAAARDTSFTETADGLAGDIRTSARDYPERIGDIVLARKDFGTSYHLSVVLDDAAQGITHVTRGADLFEATRIHVLLQELLGLPQPVYHHHPLIRDAEGRRLAKRDDARALAKYRAEGASPQDIRRMVGL